MSGSIVITAIELLKNSNVSNYAIALGTGISKPTIAKYRAGITIPNPLYADKIVKFLTTKDELTGISEKQPIIDNDTFYQQIISSQQDTIRNLSETIKNLTSK